MRCAWPLKLYLSSVHDLVCPVQANLMMVSFLWRMGLELVGQESIRSNLGNNGNICPDAMSLSSCRQCSASPFPLLDPSHLHCNMLRAPANENKPKMPCLATIHSPLAHSQVCGKSCMYLSAPFSPFLVLLNHSVWPLPHQSALQMTSDPLIPQALLTSHFHWPGLSSPLTYTSSSLPPQVVSGVNKEGGTPTTFRYMDIEAHI